MIQRDSNIIVVSRIQLLVNKNFFHLLFFDLIVKTSQNALHFGVKCSKLRWFLGRSLRHSPRPPSQHGLLAFGNRSFATSALAISQIHMFRPIYAKNSDFSLPRVHPLVPIAPRFFHLKFVPLGLYLKSFKICPATAGKT